MGSAKWGVCVLLTLLMAFQGVFLDLAQAQAEAEKEIIAVVDFKNVSGTKELDYLTKAIPESIITYLGKSGQIEIVERSRMQAALEEMKLGMTGIVDEQTAVEVGKAVGANAIMVGSFLKIEDQIMINARLIDVQTSRIITGAQRRGRVGKEIFDLMEQVAEGMQAKLLEGRGETIKIQPVPISRIPGKRIRKPLYKKWWFWAILAAGVGGGIAATQGGDAASEEPIILDPPSYPGE